jgi:ATP-dependent RNA helicase DeaD
MQKRLFSELGLSEPTLKAIEKLGFEQTSPIQSATIPALMAGKDIVGQSATGSGKTAAFAIPAIERVGDAERKVQILVLTPTRELATQVAEEFARLSLFRPKVHAVPIYGGASYDRQFSELRKGPQIVIGTPGRVIDHIQRNTLDLSDVKMAVLDECDRMLDMGFREDIEKILSVTPEGRQMVFFSATLPPPIKRLIEEFAQSPEHIKIEGTAMTVPTVEQVYFDVPPRAKLDALTRLIDVHDARLSIVFANTQRTVDDLADALIARGYAADKLHGGMTQVMRTRTMAKFKNSGFDVLVATDVAGRGIDVDDLDLVINFDLPYDPEDYVHRIGRTGRAGRKGVALTLISGREVYRLQNVERFTRQRIRRGYVPTWDQVEEKRMSGVLDKIRATIESGKQASQATYIDRLLDEGLSATDLAAAMLHELLVAEGIETQKPATGDPFARAGAPVRTAASASASPAPAVAAPKPVKAAKAKPAPALEPEPEKPAEPVAEEKPAPAPAPPAPFIEPEPEPIAEAPVAEAAPPAPPAPEKVTKPAKAAGEPEQPQKPRPVSKRAVPDYDDEEDEANEPESPAPASRPDAKPAAGSKPRELPAPASGYKWISLNLGKNDGITPRDIVDAITEGGEFPAKAVGLIKLHESETDLQVLAAHAADIVDTLDGGNFEGRTVRAHFPRTKASPFAGKPTDRKGKFSDKPRTYPGKPRPYGDKPRPYGQGAGSSERPRYGSGPPRDRDFTSRDDRPRSNYSRTDGPRSGPPRGGGGGFRKGGPKKGPGRW